MAIVLFRTPRYVLMDGSFPASLPDSHAAAGYPSKVIFGFSDKAEYDTFIASSVLTLTPYPLVKRFLSGQIELDKDAVQLVVLDAASCHQESLHAATYQSILASLQENADTVVASHRLTLDPATSQYTIEDVNIAETKIQPH